MTVLRRASGNDLPFMRAMLSYAHYWRVNAMDAEIPFSRYTEGWGRREDWAVIATEAGHRVGAGWFRIFRKPSTGYGFIDEQTPELTIGAVPSSSDDDVTQLLLTALLECAQAEGYSGVSVSVEHDHLALAIYEAAGFDQVDSNGAAVTLRRTLA
jgi:hypothetical protein